MSCRGSFSELDKTFIDVELNCPQFSVYSFDTINPTLTFACLLLCVNRALKIKNALRIQAQV